MSILDNANQFERSIAEVIISEDQKHNHERVLKQKHDKTKVELGKGRLRKIQNNKPRHNSIRLSVHGARISDFDYDGDE